MGKRRRRIVLLAFAALALGACFWLSIRAGSVTQQAVDRIALGMSLTEVEAIFGGQATRVGAIKGLVRDAETFSINFDRQIQRDEGHEDYEFGEWIAEGWNETADAMVIFDKKLRVVCRYFSQGPPGRWDEIRAWLSSLF
jgi:hypothetical protein